MAAVLAILLPIFGIVLAGFGVARLRLLSPVGTRRLGAFVYYVAIPALLFRGTENGLPAGGGGIVLAYFAAALALFAVGMLLARRAFGADLREQAVLAINVCFGNSVQMGAPVVLGAFGAPGMRSLTLIIALHSLVLLTVATIVIELGRGAGAGLARTLRSAAAAMVTNPIILAVVIGFAWSSVGVALPGAVARLVDLAAAAATPCALFVLGASLSGLRLGAGWREGLVIVALKLLALPVLVWFMARALALPPLDTAVATVTAAMPVGMNPFIFARRYDVYVAQSASAVVLSNLLSIVTLALILALFTG
jgi:malonate transporter and related proteins